MFIRSTVPFLQIVFSVLGTIAMAIVLLFPCEATKLLLLTVLLVSRFAISAGRESRDFCSIKGFTQKNE